MSVIIAGIAVSLLLQAGRPPAPATASRAEPTALEYRIGPEDALIISVWQNAELSRAVPVRPDGKISLPLLNDVQAAGLTATELRRSLTEKLKEFVPAAEVSVLVAEVNSFKVSVMGKVLRPDRYRLRSPTTVLDILAQAGGFQEYANPEKIVILRPQAAGPGQRAGFKRLLFDYKKMVTTGGEADNIALQPDDIVVVP